MGSEMCIRDRLDSTGNDRRVWSPNYAAGEAAIAIGARTVALGDASTSIGVLSMALAERSTALGVRSLVSKDAKGGMALGEESRVMSKDGLAVGNKTYSSGDGSLAYDMMRKLSVQILLLSVIMSVPMRC